MPVLSTGLIILVLLVLAILLTGIFTVQQGTIAVITMFGKYRRLAMPGLNFKVPFLEMIFKKISIL